MRPSLVTGVAGLRLAGDAVLDLWRRDDGDGGGDREAARAALVGGARPGHRAGTSASRRASPAPARCPIRCPRDGAVERRLLARSRADLGGGDRVAGATAVRMIWTADHLDAARRLQATLVDPARAATAPSSGAGPLGGLVARWSRRREGARVRPDLATR